MESIEEYSKAIDFPEKKIHILNRIKNTIGEILALKQQTDSVILRATREPDHSLAAIDSSDVMAVAKLILFQLDDLDVQLQELLYKIWPLDLRNSGKVAGSSKKIKVTTTEENKMHNYNKFKIGQKKVKKPLKVDRKANTSSINRKLDHNHKSFSENSKENNLVGSDKHKSIGSKKTSHEMDHNHNKNASNYNYVLSPQAERDSDKKPSSFKNGSKDRLDYDYISQPQKKVENVTKDGSNPANKGIIPPEKKKNPIPQADKNSDKKKSSSKNRNKDRLDYDYVSQPHKKVENVTIDGQNPTYKGIIPPEKKKNPFPQADKNSGKKPNSFKNKSKDKLDYVYVSQPQKEVENVTKDASNPTNKGIIPPENKKNPFPKADKDSNKKPSSSKNGSKDRLDYDYVSQPHEKVENVTKDASNPTNKGIIPPEKKKNPRKILDYNYVSGGPNEQKISKKFDLWKEQGVLIQKELEAAAFQDSEEEIENKIAAQIKKKPIPDQDHFKKFKIHKKIHPDNSQTITGVWKDLLIHPRECYPDNGKSELEILECRERHYKKPAAHSTNGGLGKENLRPAPKQKKSNDKVR